jgi:hypothetical protein
VTKDDKDNIKITSENGVTIYPANTYDDLITECGDEKKHHSTNGEIKDVIVDTKPPCGGCSNKRCKVVITYSK